jgi:hypothetical protein
MFSFGKSVTFVAAVVLASNYTFAQSNPCDLTGDGAVNAADIASALQLTLQVSPCATTLPGAGACNVVAAQRVINTALGGSCSTSTGGNLHAVVVTWIPSISASVLGYNLYRSTTSGTNYTKVNSTVISGTSYSDSSVRAGQTYYYVATAVDGSKDESGYSAETSATVPAP